MSEAPRSKDDALGAREFAGAAGDPSWAGPPLSDQSLLLMPAHSAESRVQALPTFVVGAVRSENPLAINPKRRRPRAVRDAVSVADLREIARRRLSTLR